MKKTITMLAGVLWLAAGVAAAEDKPQGYMSAAASKDHMVVGVEISGYHMRYDIAQAWKVFMVLLPNGYNDLKQSPAYFSIDTLPLENLSVSELMESDIKNLSRTSPSPKVAARYDGKALEKAGQCVGTRFEYQDHRRYSHEVYYFCRNRSSKYVIVLSLGATSKKDLDQRLPDFVRWANAPQIVTDQQYIEFPGR